MEGRIAKLEAHAEYANKRLDRVESKLDSIAETSTTLSERVRHLPTKGWAVGAIAVLVTLVTGIVTLAPKLQSLLGVTGAP